jgi:hypothetical protein
LRPGVTTIPELLRQKHFSFGLPIKKWQLRKSNSLWLSRARKLWQRVAHS